MKGQICCTECGYMTMKFQHWEHFAGPCFTPGRPSMLHQWEEVE